VTILVVDDEEIDRLSARHVLEKQGYSVLQAVGYSDAIAVFDMHRDSVQLLIVDIVLPDGNGCVLATALRKQKPDLRVLFVSFHVGTEVCKYYGLEVPDLHFLKKPFTGAQLASRVRKILKAADPFPPLNIPKTFSFTEPEK
jgi:two-component system cell cycle sensor histidine kinase/response regulator CckA